MFSRAVVFMRFIVYTVLTVAAVCFLILSVFMFSTVRDLPKLPQPLGRIIETPRTEIYAASGERLITLGERKSVPLSRVSPHFIDAILAIEDHLFFEHHGINKLRTLKALYITLFKPGEIQGASTITQQLAKNLFLSFEKTYVRKFKELLISFQIESSCSKNDILQAYINQIHFGAGAQGIEKASNIFFDKSAADLTLEEAALLAGLPKSPTGYNPYYHYEKALERRDVVLARMAAVGFITEDKAKAASQTRPALSRKRQDARTGSYFLDAVIGRLVEMYDRDVVYHGGIKVTATVDTRLQKAAGNSLKSGLERVDKLLGIEGTGETLPQGALVALDTGSGAVKAMVGGRDYYESEYNRALQARRLVGSGFKPFLYYTAFKQLGMHPATVVTDKPVTIPVKGAPDWKPQNFSRTHRGDMILKKALAESVNSVAAQLVEKTGPKAVVETARTCGIKSPLSEVYSVAMGTLPVTPLEMASAFSTFAEEGVRHEPFLIWRVEDPFGRVIHEHIVRENRVLDPETAYQVVDMMKAVIERGSGSTVRDLGFERAAAGKTGTTDGFIDAWFTGFTPSLCTAVWTGFDREKKLITPDNVGLTGGRAAAPIWTDFMKTALKNEPERDFPIPEKIRFEKVDGVTGCPPLPDESTEIWEVALKEGQGLCPEADK